MLATQLVENGLGHLFLSASRDSLHNFPVVQPRFDWMSENVLMVIRGLLFSTVLGFAGYSLYDWGVPGFPWFISDWAALAAIGTEFLILNAHFRDYDLWYDNLVKFCFEIVWPYTMLAVIVYWGLYYTPGLWDINDLSTWTYPIFMHVVPLAVLTIEGFLNSMVYDIEHGFWHALWLILSYIPMTYFSKDIVGYLPYPFIDWASTNSHIWVASIVGLNQLLFYGFAYLNNYVKTGSGVSINQFVKHQMQDFKGLVKLAGF
eukprot:403369495